MLEPVSGPAWGLKVVPSALAEILYRYSIHTVPIQYRYCTDALSISYRYSIVTVSTARSERMQATIGGMLTRDGDVIMMVRDRERLNHEEQQRI